jgi:hypothetical protein
MGFRGVPSHDLSFFGITSLALIIKAQAHTAQLTNVTTFYNVGQLPLFLTQFAMPPDFYTLANNCLSSIPGRDLHHHVRLSADAGGRHREDLYVYGNMNEVYLQALIGNGI